MLHIENELGQFDDDYYGIQGDFLFSLLIKEFLSIDLNIKGQDDEVQLVGSTPPNSPLIDDQGLQIIIFLCIRYW